MGACMNAYELADYLEKQYFHSQSVSDAISTLRYQADLIAELEDKLSFYEIKDLDSGLKPKPLSEKELYEVFDKCYPNNGDGDVVTLVDFARAIEKTHGIK